MYAVIKWYDENRIGIVPTSWLATIQGIHGAFYPPNNVRQRVKTNCEPAPHWAHYRAKVYGAKYGNFYIIFLKYTNIIQRD